MKSYANIWHCKRTAARQPLPMPGILNCFAWASEVIFVVHSSIAVAAFLKARDLKILSGEKERERDQSWRVDLACWKRQTPQACGAHSRHLDLVCCKQQTLPAGSSWRLPQNVNVHMCAHRCSGLSGL